MLEITIIIDTEDGATEPGMLATCNVIGGRTTDKELELADAIKDATIAARIRINPSKNINLVEFDRPTT